MSAGGGVPAAAEIVAGQPRALARLMRDLENGVPAARVCLASLAAHLGRAFVLGVTGAPGAGKSTLVDALLVAYRARGQAVGVVAVDPSSPLSGGALLGDRVRMQRHATDDGVFIRSLASRGNLGGLSRATEDVVDVLDAAGFGVVIVETVGVGQDEVEVAALADVTLVVTVPGLGDGVQALKSGLLELADVFVVNKADREGADLVEKDLQTMLALRGVGPKDVPIVRTQASAGVGVERLLDVLEARRVTLDRQAREARRRRRTELRLRAAVLSRMAVLADDAAGGAAGWAARAEAVIAGRSAFHEAVAGVFTNLRLPTSST